MASADYFSVTYRLNTPQLQAKASLVGAIRLSWPQVTGATGYVLEASNTGEKDTFVPLKTLGATELSYRHTGLYYNQRIYYRLKAVGNGEESAYSAVVSATTHNQSKVFNIMPLGDSNTEGGIGSQSKDIKVSYRAKLAQLLNGTKANGKYDFVGSEKSGSNFTSDTDHAGFGGATIQNIVDLLKNRSYGGTSNAQGLSYLQEYQPDIILLHIGTNGVDASAAAMDRLESLLNEIDAYEAASGKDVTVILAKIIKRVCYEKGCPYPVESPATIEYNNNMAAMAQRRQVNGDNLLLVDMQDGAGIVYKWGDDGGDMQDPLHPSQAGYDKMAPVWFAELSKLLDVQPVAPPDTEAPETTIASKPDALTNSSTATFSFSSNESKVVYLASIDGAAFAEVANPLTIANLADGEHTIAVKAKDAAGNIDATPATYTWAIDTKAPAVPVITAPAENALLSNNKPSITGTAEANATVTIFNRTTQLGTVKAAANGNWNFTTASALAEGELQITAKATDEAGNTGDASSVRRFTVDTKAPETTIATAPAALTNETTARFTFTSNEENVTYEVSLDGQAYETKLTPYTIANLTDGSHTLAVRAVDAAGNKDATPATHTWVVDTKAPDVPVFTSITEDRGPEADDQVTADNTLILRGTAEANAKVEIYKDASAIGQATANAAGAWVFDYTSTQLPQGTHQFTATATDAAGNKSSSSTVFKVTLDLTAPEVAITTAQKSPVKAAFEVEVKFTEQVYGLTLADFHVTNGALSNLASINSTTYKAILSPTADGEVSVGLAVNKVTDLAGNPNKASETLQVIFDGTRPQVSINSEAAAVVKAPFTVAFTFSESVTGFELEDITSANATLSGFTAQNDKVYSVLVTPAADGEVSIQVKENKAFDAAENGNAASAVFKRLSDASQPSVVLSTTAANPINEPFTVKVEFSEVISGFELEDVAVANGLASRLSKTGDKTYTLLVTPQANGEVRIAVAANKVEDVATNGNLASNELMLFYDATRPGIALSTTAASLVNTPFEVILKLTEPVTDFTLAAVAVTNATASSLEKVNEQEYKITITPANDGNVLVQVPENRVHDAATNGNMASNELSIVYDATAPGKYKVAFKVNLVDVTNQEKVALEISGAETGATYFYSITSSNGNEEVSGTAKVGEANFTLTGINLTQLEDGFLTVALYLVDEAGNKGETVTGQVEKLTRNIIAVAQPASIKVPFRTTFDQLPLPSEVKVTYANQEQESIKVNWQKGSYNGVVAGQYVVTGTLELAPKTSNTEGKTASITVEVAPNQAPTALALSSESFKPDIIPAEVIGTFSTADPDDNEFTYTLVPGQVDSDNSFFEILNNNELHLKTNQGLYGKSKFRIRVQSTDPYQNSITQEFSLIKTPFTAHEKIKLVNAFSPDGDGVNDTWTVPELRFYNNVEVSVFNRAGDRLFYSVNPEEGWDGKGINGEVVQGSYFYIIRIKDIDLVQKGVVTVLK
ncbi:Ig-like domain-containing protein [uncultured Pontibacter sp.]|uniref:Ig-like domain-containing protein n=1 Tax=uncultured Pontibacter sp. TaxID=453356 RepID=UPI0026047B25|nr:Ig-like domain-containing protein [uncultured Pontibacter sp.]